MSDRRHALITGGSSGIGLATAHLLAQRGWRVSLLARDRARLEAAARGLGAASGAGDVARVFPVDVAERADCAGAVHAAIAQSGAPDLVLACAGVARPGHFDEIPDADFERAMAVNYFGVLNTVRPALEAMKRKGGGSIVLVSSGAGLIGIFGYSAYAPSKFAVRGLAEVLRGELAPCGIRVSVVYPPDTQTPQLEEENRFKPAQTRAITSGGGVLSAQAVARAIVEGVEHGRFVIAPGPRMRLLAAWHSVLAPLLHRSFDRAARRAARSPQA
ncbi:MAG: SDR family oxidoreductase [Pseudomonadota bacterium]